jgi:hypothetical protein
VNRNVDKLVVYLMWRGGKWYLRRKLPSRRTSAAMGAAAVSACAVAVVMAKRLAG